MKNLNEPRKPDADVIPFENRNPKDRTVKQSLLSPLQVEDLRARWTAIQTSFVDEPRKSVEEADKLVSSAIKQIEEVFAAERTNLEKQWSRGEDTNTEDLRICLQHYREFFDRLLTRV